jgi:hypothetical protein
MNERDWTPLGLSLGLPGLLTPLRGGFTAGVSVGVRNDSYYD